DPQVADDSRLVEGDDVIATGELETRTGVRASAVALLDQHVVVDAAAGVDRGLRAIAVVIDEIATAVALEDVQIAVELLDERTNPLEEPDDVVRGMDDIISAI